MSDTKNFNTRGDLTIFPNENILAGKGILYTNFLRETTSGLGISIEDTELKFTNQSQQSVFSFNGGNSTLSITSGTTAIISEVQITGNNTVSGNCQINGTLSALSGIHSLTNDNSSENVLNIRNTTSSGYSSIRFYDELNTERLSIGIGNSTSSLFTSQSFVELKNGFSLVFRATSDILRINSNGTTSILNTTASTSTSTGSLIVSGGVGIAGATYTGGIVRFTNTTTSTTSTSGALVVSGGVGIGGNLYSSGAIRFTNVAASSTVSNGALVVSGGVGVSGALNVGGTVRFTNTTTSTSTTTGALVVSGGVGVGQNLNVGGTAIISGNLGVGIAPAAKLHVNSGNIRIDGNNFIEFGGNITKEISAGRIGYQTFSNALDIVGAGTSSPRLIRMFDNLVIEGSTASTSTNTGALTVSGGVGVGGSVSLGGYIDDTAISSPATPGAGRSRYFTDVSDNLFKSKTSSGTLTTYQPTNTKGDLLTHDGTTQVRLAVDPIDDSYPISNSATSTGLSWFNKAYAYIRDEKTQGTNGGTATSGSFFEKELNTITSYPLGQTFISLNAGTRRITLQPGNYYVKATSPVGSVSNHCCRLVDWTDLVVLYTGTSGRTSSGGLLSNNGGGVSKVSGIVSVVVEKVIGVQHIVEDNRTSTGRGIAHGFQTEVYTTVEVFKI